MLGGPMNEASCKVEPAGKQAILVLLGCTIAVTFGVASVFNGTISAFIKPLAVDTGWSRAQVSLGLSVAVLTLLVLNPFVGVIGDRFGARRLVILGAPLFGLAVGAVGWLPPNYPLFLAGCALVGATGALTYNTVCYAVVAQWFDRHLGLALGITASGTGIGLMIGPPAAQMFISELGWRAAYPALGALSVAMVLPAALLLIRDHPGQRAASARETSGGARVALRSPTFWRLAFVYFLTGVAINGTVVHLIPLLTDRGISPELAAGLSSYLGIGVLVSRVAAGFLLDHLDAGRLGAICFAIAAIGIGILLVPVPYIALVVAILIVGAALGAEGDVLAYVTRRVFGAESYGATIGMMVSAFLLGVLTGPLINGASFDRFGSYSPAMTGFALAMLIAASIHAGATKNLGIKRQAAPRKRDSIAPIGSE